MVAVVASLLGLTAVRLGVSRAEKRAEQTADKCDSLKNLRLLGETLEVVIIAMCAVFLVVRPFCAQAFYIPSRSMSPTLEVNDRLLVNKLAYKFGSPQRDDVIVFRAPDRAIRGSVEEETEFVKRVVGLPGDTVEIYAGRTYVNGELYRDPADSEPSAYEMAPYTVPTGKVFVLGDNRNQSNDSHQWGALDRNRVIGKAAVIFWPPSRIRTVR